MFLYKLTNTCNCFLSLPCSLDSDQKDQLIEVIEKLLADKTTVSGFGEVEVGGRNIKKKGFILLKVSLTQGSCLGEFHKRKVWPLKCWWDGKEERLISKYYPFGLDPL